MPTRETSYMRSTYWNLKSIWQAGFHKSFATQAKLRVTRKTLCLIILVMSFCVPLPTLYKPSLPTKCKRRTRSIHKKLLREKTLAKHLWVRDCLPTILYIIFLEFHFTPTSPSTHPWVFIISNTYLIHSECWEKFWCLWKALKEANEWRMQSGGIAGSG